MIQYFIAMDDHGDCWYMVPVESYAAWREWNDNDYETDEEQFGAQRIDGPGSIVFSDPQPRKF